MDKKHQVRGGDRFLCSPVSEFTPLKALYEVRKQKISSGH